MVPTQPFEASVRSFCSSRPDASERTCSRCSTSEHSPPLRSASRCSAEKSDGKSDTKDWKDKPEVSSGEKSGKESKNSGSEKKKSGGRVDLTPLPVGTEGAEIVKAGKRVGARRDGRR